MNYSTSQQKIEALKQYQHYFKDGGGRMSVTHLYAQQVNEQSAAHAYEYKFIRKGVQNINL